MPGGGALKGLAGLPSSHSSAATGAHARGSVVTHTDDGVDTRRGVFLAASCADTNAAQGANAGLVSDVIAGAVHWVGELAVRMNPKTQTGHCLPGSQCPPTASVPPATCARVSHEGRGREFRRADRHYTSHIFQS